MSNSKNETPMDAQKSALGCYLGFSKNLHALMDAHNWPKRGRATLVKNKTQVSYQTALSWLNDDVVPKGARLLQLINVITGEADTEARETIGRLFSGTTAENPKPMRELISSAWECALAIALKHGALNKKLDVKNLRFAVEMVCDNAERQQTQNFDSQLLEEIIVREIKKTA